MLNHIPACGLTISSKLCFMENHQTISLNRGLLLVVTAWIRSHDNAQLCSTAGNGKSPALASFPLFTEQTKAFLFLSSKQRRGRIQCECVSVPPFHKLQDANPSPSKHSHSLLLQGAEPSLLFTPPSTGHSPVRI